MTSDQQHPRVFENAEAMGAGYKNSSNGSSLRDFLTVFWRRKWVLAGMTGSLMLITWIYIQQITPIYKAEATLIVETRRTRVVNIDEVLGGLNGRMQQVIRGEEQVLKSRNLAVRVIKDLRLETNPDFNTKLRPPKPPSVLAQLNPRRYIPDSWINLLRFGGDPAKRNKVDPVAMEVDGVPVRLVQRLQSRLGVKRVEFSPAIIVTYRSASPELAKLVANGISNAYLTSQLEAKFEAVERATGWLNDRLQELKTNVEIAEQAVQNYRKKKGLVKARGPSISDQQFTELNTQLILIRAKRSEAEARLRQAGKHLRAAGGQRAFSESLDSPVMQNLRAEELTLRRRLSELSNRYGEKHPKIINARSEMREIVEKLGAEQRKIIEVLENEVSVTKSREKALSQSIRGLKRDVSKQDEAEIELRSLIREADATKALYETFLTRFKETNTQRDLQGADARIISAAVLPTVPSSPRKTIIMLSAFVGGVMLGMFLIFVIEEMDPGFRSAQQVESILGYPCLGLIPETSGAGLMRAADPDNIRKNPASSFAESIRSLRTGLMFTSGTIAPKVVMVTSSEPSEGKSLIAYCIAALTALSREQKAIIVEADLRRPDVHKLANVNETPGLTNHLQGDATLDEVIRTDDRFGLDYITSGASITNPGDLLESERLREVIKELRTRYDLVVVDTPPVMAVSDARVLAPAVDKVVFLVRWAHTKREAVRTAADMIGRTDPGMVSLALNRVNVRKHARYGYGDSGTYYGYYRRYYVR